MNYDILDLTKELKEKIKFQSMRRDTYVLAVNVLRELRILNEKYSKWRKKYEKKI